jgi:hypothetical protein
MSYSDWYFLAIQLRISVCCAGVGVLFRKGGELCSKLVGGASTGKSLGVLSVAHEIGVWVGVRPLFGGWSGYLSRWAAACSLLRSSYGRRGPILTLQDVDLRAAVTVDSSLMRRIEILLWDWSLLSNRGGHLVKEIVINHRNSWELFIRMQIWIVRLKMDMGTRVQLSPAGVSISDNLAPQILKSLLRVQGFLCSRSWPRQQLPAATLGAGHGSQFALKIELPQLLQSRFLYLLTTDALIQRFWLLNKLFWLKLRAHRTCSIGTSSSSSSHPIFIMHRSCSFILTH